MAGNLLVTALLVTVIALSVAAASGWDYNHQENWGGVCASGRRQSPIDIITADALHVGPTKDLTFINWDYELSGGISNNGHTLKFTPFEGLPDVKTKTHLGEYKLKQFHVHWGENDMEGSEHLIDGRSAALEFHFVHERVSESGTESERYAVVGILAYPGDESPESPLIKTMPISHVKSYGAEVAAFVRVGWFLPPDHSYYYYQGSLTTPGCDEKVQWFVMRQHITVSRSVLRTLRDMQTEGGEKLTFNYRDVQPLNGRSVYYRYDPPFATVPLSLTLPVEPPRLPPLRLPEGPERSRSEDTDRSEDRSDDRSEESSQSDNSKKYFRYSF